MRSVNQVCDELNGLFPFAQLAKLLPDAAPFYLVGGALRDLFLGRACSDLDFAAAFDPTALARTLAAILVVAGFFWMNRVGKAASFCLLMILRFPVILHPCGPLVSWRT